MPNKSPPDEDKTDEDITVSEADFAGVEIPGAMTDDTPESVPEETSAQRSADEDSATAKNSEDETDSPAEKIDLDFDGVSIPGAEDDEAGTTENTGVEEDQRSTSDIMSPGDAAEPSEQEPPSVEAEPSSPDSENDSGTSESEPIDTDFSGVSIAGSGTGEAASATESDTSEVNVVETNSETEGTSEDGAGDGELPESWTGGQHDFGEATEDTTAFSDPDASETWGSDEAIDVAGFERPEVETEQDAEDEADTVEPVTEAETQPEVRDTELDDLFGEDSHAGEAADSDGDSGVDLDFGGVEIEGATGETAGPDEADTEPDTADERTVGDSGNETQQVESDHNDGDTTESETDDPVEDPSPAEPDEESWSSSLGDSETEPPGGVPEQRIRSPREILWSPLAKTVSASRACIAVLAAIAILALRGTLILMEWGASILLVFYTIAVGAALLLPMIPIGSSMQPAGEVGGAIELTLTVLPVVIGVFAMSMLVDKVFFDGKRYGGSGTPTFRRL